MQRSADSKATTESEENFKAVGKLSDRSGLSDEMKDLCAELPIYRIRKINEKQNDADQMEDPIMGANDLVDVVKEGVKGKVVEAITIIQLSHVLTGERIDQLKGNICRPCKCITKREPKASYLLFV